MHTSDKLRLYIQLYSLRSPLGVFCLLCTFRIDTCTCTCITGAQGPLHVEMYCAEDTFQLSSAAPHALDYYYL